MRHQRVIDTAGRTRRTLYVVGGFYVAIGFMVAVPSAMAGDRLSAFLGFLIVSGALGFVAALTLVLRLSVRVSAIGESIEDVSRRLERLAEAYPNPTGNSPAGPVAQESCMLDLSAIGPGDPAILAAATLERAAFPRLVASMDDAPPPEAAVPPPQGPSQGPSGDPSESRFEKDATLAEEPLVIHESAGLADKNLLRVWKLAMREGDLATCREVWSTLIDTADPVFLARMSSQLEELSKRTERSLRLTFVGSVRRRDYDGALAIGQQIIRLFPDDSLAREFQEIEPHLRRRAREARDISPPRCGTGVPPVTNESYTVSGAREPVSVSPAPGPLTPASEVAEASHPLYSPPR